MSQEKKSVLRVSGIPQDVLSAIKDRADAQGLHDWEMYDSVIADLYREWRAGRVKRDACGRAVLGFRGESLHVSVVSKERVQEMAGGLTLTMSDVVLTAMRAALASKGGCER